MPALATARSRLMTVLTLMVALLATGAVTAAPARADAVSDLLGMVNRERAAAGLGSLRLAADLSEVARQQSQRMASSSTLYHNPDLAKQVTNWLSLAENVGYGGSVPVVHDAFMASSGHRANILGRYTEVGLGIVASGSRVWVTEVFRLPQVETVATAAPSCSVALPEAGTTSLSVRRSGYWYVRNTLTSGAGDGCFPLGNPGDLPVSGDWDGNGSKTPGVFRPSTGTWYLSNDPAGRAVHRVLAFGSPGDVPVAGDWNGDKVDGVGVFRPSNGTWYLRNALSSGPAEGAVAFASPGDRPVVGDWNHDGVDTLGVFRPSTGTWYLTNSFSNRVHRAVRYGSPGDLPVVGDWNRDGVDTPGVFRGGLFYLSDAFTGVANRVVRFGSPGDVPVVRTG